MKGDFAAQVFVRDEVIIQLNAAFEGCLRGSGQGEREKSARKCNLLGGVAGVSVGSMQRNRGTGRRGLASHLSLGRTLVSL